MSKAYQKGFKITINSDDETMNKFYSTKVKGWSVKRIDTALKQMFDSNKTDFQKKYDELLHEYLTINGQLAFEKISHVLAKKRCEALQKRFEQVESNNLQLIKKNSELNYRIENQEKEYCSRLQTADKWVIEHKQRNTVLKEQIIERDKDIEKLNFEIAKVKEIAKSNSDSWDEMYHKLNGRKTLKQQLNLVSSVLVALSLLSFVIAAFSTDYTSWIKTAIVGFFLSYIVCNKAFIKLLIKIF